MAISFNTHSPHQGFANAETSLTLLLDRWKIYVDCMGISFNADSPHQAVANAETSLTLLLDWWKSYAHGEARE